MGYPEVRSVPVMSLFKKRKSVPTTLKVTVYSGEKRLEVRGEVYYQDALAQLAGPKTEDGYDLPVDCVLIREPDNEFDANAIAVYAAQAHTDKAVMVGHVNRVAAVVWAPVIDAKNAAGEQVGLVGRIRGGWERGDGDSGYYGITLFYDPADFEST